VSALGGAVAAMQAMWGLKILLNQTDDVAGHEVYFDFDARRLTSHRIVRNPRCLFDHDTWRLVPLDGNARNTTVGQTLTFAERVLGSGACLQVPRRAIATSFRCPSCGADAFPYRVVDAADASDIRCACGAGMHALAAGLLDRFSREEARLFLDRTWAEVGLPPEDVIVAAGGGRQLHMLLCDSGR
jgi:hypothetical protein